MLQRPIQAKGFSLIELLAVVLIVGLGISVAVMNVGSGNSAYQLRTEAKQFANLTALVAEEAVLSRTQWGVDLYRDVNEAGNDIYGYRWLALDKDQGWIPKTPIDMEEEIVFSSTTLLELELEGAKQIIGDKKDPPKADDSDADKTDNSSVTNRGLDDSSDDGQTRRDALKPDIYLFSSGEATAFQVIVSDLVSPELQQFVKGDALGRIKLESGDDEQ